MTRILVTTSSPGGPSNCSTLPGGSSSGSRPFRTARARWLPTLRMRVRPAMLHSGGRPSPLVIGLLAVATSMAGRKLLDGPFG
jgi:hypothetical protein